MKLDDSDLTPGFKFNKWEQKGASLRVEFGPRDFQNNQVVIKLRDEEEKITVALDRFTDVIEEELNVMQKRLLEKARQFRDANSHVTIDSLQQLQDHITQSKANKNIPGWILAGWCGSNICEQKVKDETKFTSRNIPFNPPIKKIELYLLRERGKTHSLVCSRILNTLTPLLLI